MNRTVATAAAFAVAALMSAGVTPSTAATPVQVFVAGDSTASTYVSSLAPRAGWGQALPVFFDKLPNGDVLIHATGDFVTANGTRLEGRGVIPDEPIAVTRQDLLAGRDAAEAAALAWIDAQRK